MDRAPLSPDRAEAVEARLSKLRKWHRSASTVLPTLGKLLG